MPGVLRGGVNDLGGTLMEETISRMAGSENGSYKTISGLRELVAPTGRPLRQRTTGYGEPSAERMAAAAASDGVCAVGAGHADAAPASPALTGAARSWGPRPGSASGTASRGPRQARITGPRRRWPRPPCRDGRGAMQEPH